MLAVLRTERMVNRFTRADWNVIVPVAVLAALFILALVLLVCS